MTDPGSSGEEGTKGSSKRASMSTIESSVTRLLVSTKHLLESLTQWARQEADDKFVSDAYVKLGNDFRAAARAFTTAGVDISDLGDVPKALRIVLESALSEAPTQENLDRFLPNIRNIIVSLLLNLKAKQLKAKEVSLEKVSKQTTNLDSPSTTDSKRSSRRSIENTSTQPRKSKLLSEHQIKSQSDEYEKVANNNLHTSSEALAQLQKGNVILRRASKRFSAYQFAKLTNIPNNQLPRITGDDLSNSSPGPSVFKADTRNDKPIESHTSNLSTVSIYLRNNDNTKKVTTHLPTSLASLRLLFVEKFAYSPGSSAFPDIYVMDPHNNVAFELEELNIEAEVKNGTLLFLKQPTSEDVAIKSLERKIETLNGRMESMASTILENFKDIVKTVESKPQANAMIERAPGPLNKNAALNRLFDEVDLEFRAIRQHLAQKRELVTESISQLSEDLSNLKMACFAESSIKSNRIYMEQSYAKLSEDSDLILTKVDELQDIMEALRKDVAQRGVRLGPKQLKSTRKEIEDAKGQLDNLGKYIADGKPAWKRIWEAELDKVCEEQQFFNLQDDLTQDLEEDIKKIEETFDLIEQCSLEQSKLVTKKSVFTSRLHIPEPGENLHDLRDAVLNEVAALVPNHESRLDAIAKAERLRAKERENSDITQFQEELGGFVEDKRLKKSGGIEELERLRRQKDIENLKSSFGIV